MVAFGLEQHIKTGQTAINNFQSDLVKLVEDNFDLRPASILEEFDLRNLPRKMGGQFFIKTASYGHFGREDLSLPWEKVDKKSQELIESAIGLSKIT